MPLGLFRKTPLPDKIPEGMQQYVEELKKLDSKMDCLKMAYSLLARKYHGNRIKTYTRLLDVFIRDADKLWKKNGFLHCTNLNYLLRTLLIYSGHFSESELRLCWTLTWYFSPHQYLRVKIENEWVNVDVWAKTYGIKFGDYAHGFH